MTQHGRGTADEPLLWLLGGFAALAGLLWATAQLAAFLSGQGPVSLDAGSLSPARSMGPP